MEHLSKHMLTGYTTCFCNIGKTWVWKATVLYNKYQLFCPFSEVESSKKILQPKSRQPGRVSEALKWALSASKSPTHRSLIFHTVAVFRPTRFSTVPYRSISHQARFCEPVYRTRFPWNASWRGQLCAVHKNERSTPPKGAVRLE